MSRMPLRLRFACLTALSVVLGGFAVLALNYLLLQDRLGPSIERVPVSDVEGPSGTGVDPDLPVRESNGTGVSPAPRLSEGAHSAVPAPDGEPPRETSSEVVVLQRRFEQTALRVVLAQSAIALAVTAAAALAVAWLVAGRYLTPIRALTGTARELSESTLHRRIRHEGPRDEIHDLADSFDRMLDRLERAFEAQRRFIANASHELRTPVTVSRTAMEVLASKPSPTVEQVQTATATVVSAAERSERTIAGLLALARADQGLDRREPVRLEDVLSEAVEARRELAAHLGVSVERAGTAARVSGDPALLESLVGNLLDNALKYNRPGGWVRVTTGTTGGRAWLRVDNTGEVLPEGAEGWVFEPFRRGRADRHSGRDGSGLGLAIVRAIASAHGGEVAAQRRDGGGLSVQVSLPALAPGAPADARS